MPETDCLNCGCSSHRGKKCTNCGNCSTWLRADQQMARAATATNNILANYIPMALEVLYNISDLLCEQFPEATERVRIKREELANKQMEQELVNQADDPSAWEDPIQVPKQENTNDVGTDTAANDDAGTGTIIS